MKRWPVILPPVVQEQIRAQVFHIALDSVDNALAWEGRLRAAVSEIGDTPGGYPVDEAATARLGKEVRKMVFERTYLVFYFVNRPSETVEILNFRHGARLPRGDDL